MNKHKEEIIKIFIASLLLIAAITLNSLLSPTLLIKIIIFAVPYLVIGGEVLKESIKGACKGNIFDECFLMSIASIGAFFIGEYAEAVFVMLFFSVGELFEDIASDKSRHSVKSLMELKPEKVNIEKNDNIIEVDPETVNKDDIIVIKPGEKIGLDGIIIEGNSTLDMRALTGESMPVSVYSGSKILSGSVNLTGVLKVQVTNIYSQSTVSKILSLIEDAADKKSKPEHFITRFSKIYTPIVVLTAILLAIFPSLITGKPSVWIYRALMFLVVSCPCALVVSVPLSYFSAIGGASKCGILIKGSDALECLANIGTAVFDKTGTLTKGSFEVTEIHSDKLKEDDFLKLVASIEKLSDHPVARSIRAKYNGEFFTNVNDITEIPGHGVTAIVNNKKIYVGNSAMMKDIGIAYTEISNIGTTIYVSYDDEYIGYITISDVIKPESHETISTLKKHNIHTVMLTGDTEDSAFKVANEIEIDEFCSSLLPQDKANILEKIIASSKSGKKTVFIGDGINDAPVIATADVGIAMGALGSDAAIETADIVICDDNISKVKTAVSIAEKTNRIVKQNIYFSICFKIAVLLLSVLGLSNMWLASFADVGVLVLAVLNATRNLKNPVQNRY